MVIAYLNHFGKVLTNKVVYGVYGDGPFKGLRNGDRSFKLELKPSANLGSYHILDGQRVSIKYPGQAQTCARCLMSARVCKGRGIARKCEAEQGLKADFSKYIMSLWNEIGYNPNINPLSDSIMEGEEQAANHEQGSRKEEASLLLE